MTKYHVLHLLEQDKGNVISGMEMAKKLGVSRNAVWKAVNTLKKEGYTIKSIPNGGYVWETVEQADILSMYEIQKRLVTKSIGRNGKMEPLLDSTNSELKKQAFSLEEGYLLTSEAQSAGRGRLKRSFQSDSGMGAYFSLLLKPDCYMDKLHLVTICAACAVAEFLKKEFRLDARIKWPNDIICSGKKICGILTESSVEQESGFVEWVIVGIGVNLGQEKFPEELINKAVSLRMLYGQTAKRAEVIAGILNEFEPLYLNIFNESEQKKLIRQYQKLVELLKEERRFFSGGKVFNAVPSEIDGEGRLILKHRNGQVSVLLNGDMK